MGIFQYVDSQTGKGYDFTISGENPSDVEFAKIAQILQQDREEDLEAYKATYGADLYVDDGTALGRGASRGFQQVKEAVGETIGTIGEQSGLGFLEKYGTGVEDRARQQQGMLSLEQPKRLQSTDVDGFGSALTYAGEVIGEQGTQLGLGLGAAALGTAAAPVLAPVLGAAAPFVAGATAAALATAPILFGNNIQRQEDEVAAGKKDRVDVGYALTATFGQAALEGVADRLLLGGFKLLKPVGSTKEGWKGLLTRTGSRAAGGSATESLTEVGQQMLERAQAGLPIDSDEAYAEYREAAIAGGLIGAGTRATTGAFGDAKSTILTPKVTPVTTSTIVTAEMLDGVGVFPRASVRQKIIGKDINDKDVQALLQNYAKNSIIRNKVPDIEARIEALINENMAQPGAGELELETLQSKDEVGGAGGSVSNSVDPKEPNNESVGADLSDSSGSGGPAGPEFNTLEEAAAQQKDDPVSRFRTLKKGRSIEKGSIYDLYPDATTIRDKKYGKGAGIQPRVSRTIYMPYKEAGKIGGLFQSEEIPVQFTATDDNKAKLIHLEPYGTGKNQKKAGSDASETVTFEVQPRVGLIPVEILNDKNNAPGGGKNIHFGNEIVEVDVQAEDVEVDIQAGDVTLSKAAENLKKQVEEGLIIPNIKRGDRIRNSRAFYTVDKDLNRVGGPFLENDRTVLNDGSTQENTTGEKASDPYDAMLDAPDVSQEVLNSQAQEALNVRFFTPQKATKEGIILTKAREFHESTEGKALFDTGDPDLTTLEDKQVILSLLDNPVTKEDKAAVAFFDKYRRLDVALDQIGALSKIGDGKNEVSMRTVAAAKKASTRDAFYFDQTKKRAIPARVWVENNMSPQANSIMKSALEAYGKDTSAYIIPDDIRIGDREATYDYAKQDKEDAIREYNNKRNAHNHKIINEDNAFIDDGVEYIDDSIIGYDLDAEFFLLDPVQGLNTQLLPDAKNGLRNNNIKAVLLSIAGTNPVSRIRQIAGKLADVVGTTQVQVVDDLSTMVGRKAAGMFRPKTNTIFIDANIGMNVHTVLHEMAHATTSAALANPNLPEVKQLQVLLKAAREQLGDVYGTKNLDEFVAEAFGNPEFQAALALMSVDGGKMAGWKKFLNAVVRAVRKAIGFKPKPPESPLDDIDNIIMGMLAPSPATRGAPDMLLMGRTVKGATALLRKHITAVPLGDKNRYEQARDFISENTPRKLKQFVLAVQPVNNLARLAKDKIPFANELNVLIDQTSGKLREAFEPVDVLYNDYRAYRKANPEGYNRMQALMNRATQDEVDPARLQSTYDKYWLSYYDMVAEKTVMEPFNNAKDRNAEIKRLDDELKQKFGGQEAPRTKAKKAGEPSDEKKAIWKTLNDTYKLLGPEGQRLYKVTRNMGEAAQDRIMPAIKARISSLGVDAEAQKTAFEKLSDLLHAQGGVIRPYFKLGRDGDFRLSYNAPDPSRNGGIEVFTEYYTSEKDMLQAQQNVIEYLERTGESARVANIEVGLRDAQRDYSGAPKSSFVFSVLDALQKAKVDQKTITTIIDLSLDAIPERSFMQSFRSRKERETGGRGILGALGDVTPSGMPGIDVDPAERFRENFRNIEKQLIQLEQGAKIQVFRNKLKEGKYLTNLDTADIAKKLDQIAEFAQSPSMARWSQIATSMGFGWTMGGNISSALNVMFDIPMAVHPYLAGEYGAGKATKAIADATKLFMGSPSTKMITLMGADGNPEIREVKQGNHNKGMDNHNFDDPNLDPEIRMNKILVEVAGARGMFNQSIDQEHVDLSSRRDVLAKMNQVSGFLVHHGERFGRQISLIAANKLALFKITEGKREPTQAEYYAAAEKAMEATELTLGSTASAGRPVWAQTAVGNVAFLFKRFAVSRYYFMAHLVDQSLAGADAETRKVARNQLAYFMVTTASLAGVAGLPLMGAVGAIYDMFADEDEDDFEAMMRKLLPGTVYDGLANELLGVDIASRVSMNSLLYRQPFIDKDQSRFWTLIEQLGGPVVGVGLSMERGYDLWQEGEVQRGLEAVAPAALRNISKYQRFSTEGANTMRGNPIVDDINPYNSFMQLLGFAPADYVENLKINSSERRRQNAVDTGRRKLMRQHNMARTEGDREAVREVRKKIREFNQSLPTEYRDSAISIKALESSYTGFLTTTGKMVNGIVYTDGMRRSAEEYE